jgi:hypothetical protein
MLAAWVYRRIYSLSAVYNDRFGPNFLFSIPEPSTLTLLAIGCIACVQVARRKSPSKDRV